MHTHSSSLRRRSLLSSALLLAATLLGCAGRTPGPTDDIMTPAGGRGSPRIESAASAAPAAGSAVTTVLLVRHAERPAGGDPSLDAVGQARAQALADALASAGVTAIYTTQYRRTQETAAPLAQRLGITAQVIAAQGGESVGAHVSEVASAIRTRHAGGVVLVVGHSNTIPLIVRALGGTAPDLAESEYANLFVVTLPASGAVRTIRAKYGM
jgi:broad specificity phosphatase PhoE